MSKEAQKSKVIERHAVRFPPTPALHHPPFPPLSPNERSGVSFLCVFAMITKCMFKLI